MDMAMKISHSLSLLEVGGLAKHVSEAGDVSGNEK